MDFKWFLIISVVIWVITSVLRSQEEPKPQPRRRPRRPDPKPGNGRAPQQEPSNEIERFLQEIDRLRQRDGEAERPQPSRAESAPPPRRRPDQPRREPRPKPRPAPQSRRETREEPIEFRLPEPRTDAPSIDDISKMAIAEGSLLGMDPDLQSKKSRDARAKRARGPLTLPGNDPAGMMRALLSRPDSAAAAFLLQEIFARRKS